MRSLRSSLLSCTLALAMVGCSSEKPAPVAQIPEVGVITVTAQVVPYTFTFVAQTESSRQVEIVARELSKAAAEARVFLEYQTRYPEALIKGKAKEE